MVKEETPFMKKEIFIFSSSDHFVQWSGTISAILVESIMWNMHAKSF